MNTETQPAKAGRREWLGLLVIALPCLLYAMDLTVLNLALPKLSEALRPTHGAVVCALGSAAIALLAVLVLRRPRSIDEAASASAPCAAQR